jgi:DNA-binding XRE family transcriptional regulator
VHVGAHRLVWQYFKGDIPCGDEVNHDNGLKDDNRPSNLLCGTGGENVKHAHRTGLIDQHGQKNPAAKLGDNQVAQIRLAYAMGGYTQAQLAQRFGVCHQAVSRIVRGQSRPKQGGPTNLCDHRHAGEQDPGTGRFVRKRSPQPGA